MKRYGQWLILPVVLALFFSMTACGGSSEVGESDAGNSAPAADTDTDKNEGDENMITLTVNGSVLTATLVDNSSAEALKKLLANGPLTVQMSDYANMEKVGSLGTRLPTNDEQITTEAGDLILYQGNALVIYYAPNSWNFTRLGRINNVTAAELKRVLGGGNVSVTLTLGKE